MPSDLPFTVYRDQLSTRSHGLALWKPDPNNFYDKVSIGDVGFVREGMFYRMFNVMLPWNHPSNLFLAIPEPYDPLDVGPFTNTIEAQVDKVVLISRFVTAETDADDEGSITYKFRNRGALLSLPNGGRRIDVIRTKSFEDYIRDHVDKWYNWALRSRLDVDRMEDLILVSGCTLVSSWAAAAFADDNFEAEISLASRSLSNVGASFVWGNFRGLVSHHNSHFDPKNPPVTEDQCVFMRGFRAERVLFGIRVIQIGSSRADENEGNVGLRYTTFSPSGSRSNLDTTVPTNHENPQLLPYPSSITLPSNGSIYNASFMTSPSYDSLIQVYNIAEILGAQMRPYDPDDPTTFPGAPPSAQGPMPSQIGTGNFLPTMQTSQLQGYHGLPIV